MGVNVEVIRACLASEPVLRQDACAGLADELGLSEGDLVSAHVGAVDRRPSVRLAAVRLDVSDWPALWAGLLAGARWLEVVAGGVRLRVPGRGEGAADWDVPGGRPHSAFAVTWHGAGGARRSVQCFDLHGRLMLQAGWFAAVGDVLWTDTDRVSWEGVRATWAHHDQCPGLQPAPAPAGRSRVAAPSPQHVQALRTGWCAQRRMEDHAALRRQTGLADEQVLEWADRRYAQVFEIDLLYGVLQEALSQGLALSVRVAEVAVTVGWSAAGWVRELGGMSAQVSLHGAGGARWVCREAAVGRAWMVSVPTARGLRQTLELFDPAGRRLAEVAALRPSGQGESCLWRAILQRNIGSPDAGLEG